jgi:hypothetical protein
VHILGIDVAYLHTPNGAELAQWFVDTLGLTISYNDENWYSFDTEDGSGFGLDVTGFPRSIVEAQPIVLSWGVDDIHQAVTELAERGVRFYPAVDDTVFDVGPKLVATFQDPDGNWHQLSQLKA